ncbi:hypothetical protein GCM10011405_25630 [Rufibacter glacialis]|nr:hypothetical protein GCM10011405_25630 [Rufibacter glacialis]
MAQDAVKAEILDRISLPAFPNDSLKPIFPDSYFLPTGQYPTHSQANIQKRSPQRRQKKKGARGEVYSLNFTKRQESQRYASQNRAYKPGSLGKAAY